MRSSETKRTLIHLFLFTNSAQTELVSICTQSIHNCNERSLHYNHGELYPSCTARTMFNVNNKHTQIRTVLLQKPVERKLV